MARRPKADSNPGYQAVGSAKVLAETEVVGVGFQEIANLPVAFGNCDLRESGIRLQVDPNRHAKMGIPQSGRRRHVDEGIGSGQNLLEFCLRQAKDTALRRNRAVGPAFPEPAPLHEPRDVCGRMPAAVGGVRRPVFGVFQVDYVVTEASQALEKMEPLPGNARYGISAQDSQHDDTKRPAHGMRFSFTDPSKSTVSSPLSRHSARNLPACRWLGESCTGVAVS